MTLKINNNFKNGKEAPKMKMKSLNLMWQIASVVINRHPLCSYDYSSISAISGWSELLFVFRKIFFVILFLLRRENLQCKGFLNTTSVNCCRTQKSSQVNSSIIYSTISNIGFFTLLRCFQFKRNQERFSGILVCFCFYCSPNICKRELSNNLLESERNNIAKNMYSVPMPMNYCRFARRHMSSFQLLLFMFCPHIF
jgi:hypothetical protein